MRALLRSVVRYPLATALGVAVISLGGLYAAFRMPVDLFPNLDVPVVNIITHYPGASPGDMELLISRPIEDALRTIVGVRRVSSTSVQGMSRVTTEFAWGTSVPEARQAVQTKLAQVESTLPTGVTPRLENIGTTLQEVVGYVVYGGDPVTLRTIVRHDLASRLMAVEGVSSVEVLGGDRRAFYVRLDPAALARLRLSVSGIVSDLRQHNLTTVAGYLDRSSRDYLIRGDARLETLDDVRSVPVAIAGGRTVPLGSIARVAAGRAPRHYTLHGDGVPAVAFLVRKQPGASSIRVARDVEAALPSLRGLLPPGTHVKKFYDQSEIVSEARTEIFGDLLLGAALTILVLYFFLGSLRPTLIVAATIPISLLAALAVMGLTGLSLNVITMTALALAIGMIVDDAIVVAENIERHRRAGMDDAEGCIAGAAEIAGADASGTFTTVAAFVPLILTTGIAGLFLRPFGLTTSAALLASLVLSLTLVPLLFSRVPIASIRSDFRGARLLAAMNEKIQRVLGVAFRHRWWTLAAAFAFLALAGLSTFLGTVRLLPPIDEGALLIEYHMPPGTALSESDRMGDLLERVVRADPDVSCVYRRTGSPENGYQVEGVNVGELTIKLKPRSERSRTADEMLADFRKRFRSLPGVVILYHQPTQERIDESFSGVPALFGVTVYGPNTDTLAAIGARVEAIMKRNPSISDIVNNSAFKAPQIDVRVDHLKLAQYGVGAGEVLTTLRAANLGVEATDIVRQKRQIPVLVTVANRGSRDLSRIRSLPVVTRSGEIVPLDRVADIRVAHTPVAITRLNGQREITLVADVGGDISSVASRLREQFRSLRLPAGYSVGITGQYRVLMQTLKEMTFVVVAAVLLIYLIMAMQFRSWLEPLVILLTIPLSLVGALVALFVTRQGLDVSVGMGAITLVGISVNNAIVLLDYANRRLAEGSDLAEGLRSAVSVRLRPILLTALTTLFALIPAAIGTTVGSRIFQPFAITVIGGLLSGAAATLIVVPTAMMAFKRRAGADST